MQDIVNNYEGLIEDDEDFDQDLYDKFVEAPVKRIDVNESFDEGFNRSYSVRIQILDREFEVELQSEMNNTGVYEEVRVGYFDGDDPCLAAPKFIQENTSFNQLFYELKEEYYSDLLETPDYEWDDMSVDSVERPYKGHIQYDISMGGKEFSVTLWKRESNGNYGRLCDAYGCCDLLYSRHPIKNNLRFGALKAHFASDIGKDYECDFSVTVCDESGQSLAHWAAENQVLPDDFKQWKLKDNSNETVIETALDNASLPYGFKEFGLKFKSGGEDTTVAKYIIDNNIKKYMDEAVEYEEKARKRAEKKAAKVGAMAT